MSCYVNPPATLPWEKNQRYPLDRGQRGRRGWYGILGGKKYIYTAVDGSKTMMFLLPMTSPHRARFQDVPVHILAMHLYLLGNTNPYYPQPFQAIFGLCLQTTTHFFFSFSL